MTDGPTVRVLASQLLRHAAEFFDFVADQNPDLSDMMTANQEGYRMMADRLDRLMTPVSDRACSFSGRLLTISWVSGGGVTKR